MIKICIFQVIDKQRIASHELVKVSQNSQYLAKYLHFKISKHRCLEFTHQM